jgi:pyrroloquinoline quinone biosynthesis protein D
VSRPLPQSACPRLADGYRLQWEEAQGAWVLLFPEGMITLNASAAEILRRVDGARNVEAIVADLEAAYPGTELRADVVELLAIAAERGWLRGLDGEPAPRPAGGAGTGGIA